MKRGSAFSIAVLLAAVSAAAQAPAPSSVAAAPSASASAPSASASAAAPDPAAPEPPSSAAAAPPAPPEASCTERLPAGKARPSMTEAFPARGQSGYALPLVLTLGHGQAETVLPTGFHFDPDSAEAKALKAAGFIVPAADGGAGPKVERTEGATTTSKVTLSFVALPKEPGRHVLTLPPLPITVARASGELVTLCTQPHTITVEDPTSSTPDPKPKLNPPPRSQREEWLLLKQIVTISAIALPLGALLAWLISLWLRRPKPVPPPPPPRPPWEVALESLYDLRHAGLTREGRFAEHFDRVSDILRRYLGDRYGFDGLESTTREMLGELRATTPRIPVLDEIERFLRQADLVKFAQLTPTEPECSTALTEATNIVERTVPPPVPAGAPPLETVAGAPPPDEEEPHG